MWRSVNRWPSPFIRTTCRFRRTQDYLCQHLQSGFASVVRRPFGKDRARVRFGRGILPRHSGPRSTAAFGPTAPALPRCDAEGARARPGRGLAKRWCAVGRGRSAMTRISRWRSAGCRLCFGPKSRRQRRASVQFRPCARIPCPCFARAPESAVRRACRIVSDRWQLGVQGSDHRRGRQCEQCYPRSTPRVAQAGW